MDSFLASYILLWLLFLLLTVTILALAREVAILRHRLGPEPGALATTDGPKIGSVAPSLSGVTTAGREISVSCSDGITLLLFVSAHCDPCLKLLPQIPAFLRQNPDVSTYIIGEGHSQEFQELSSLFEIDVPLILDDKGHIRSVFDVNTTPFGISLDREWRVRSKGIPNDQEHLEALSRMELTVTPVGLNLHKRGRTNSALEVRSGTSDR